MVRKLKSGEELTSIAIKTKTIASFKILKLMSGKTHTQFLEEIGKALDPLIEHYYKDAFIDRKPFNLIVSREGKFKGIVKSHE